MPYLELRDLRVTISTPTGPVRAVNGVDLTVERDEIVGLVGESGCGKTMTGLVLIGLTPPQSRVEAARMALADIDLLRCDWREVRGRRIAMIFQDPSASLNPVFRIGDPLERVLRRHTALDRSARRARAAELLSAVGLSDRSLLRRYPHELSGGMQQRVMIALALASGAELLIADEPTTALDVTIQAQILRLLVSLRERYGLSVLFISHDLGVVAQICDRVAVLYAGRVVETAHTEELFRHAQHPYTRALLAALPQPAARGQAPVVRQLSPTHSVACYWRPAVLDPLLNIQDLHKHYRVRTGLFTYRWARAVDGVSLTLNAGETLGLVGESGCGKTTLARSILRIVEPSAGTIVFSGNDLLRLDRARLRAKRRELAIVYQNPYLSLSPRLRVADLIGEPLRTHTELRGAMLMERVIALIHSVGLSEEFLFRRAHELSGGQAQRVAIARALALSPKLLILDEPTSALDVSVQAQLLNLLASLQRIHGIAYLLISHNLAVVQHLAKRIAVMYLGRIVESGTAEAIFQAPTHPYTRALVASTLMPDPRQARVLATYEGFDGHANAISELRAQALAAK